MRVFRIRQALILLVGAASMTGPVGPAAHACCPPDPAVASSWTANAGFDMARPVVATDALGGAYITWSDSSEIAVRVVASQDDGASWIDALLLRNVFEASTAVAPEGRVYVAYSASGDVSVRVSPNQGASFRPRDVVSPPASYGGSVSAAAGAGGLAAIAWSCTATAGSTVQGTFVAVTTDGGATWLPATRLDATPSGWQGAFTVRAAISGGTIVVAWTENENFLDTDFELYESHSTDGGASWSPPQRPAAPPTGVPTAFDLGATSNGHWQIAYMAGPTDTSLQDVLIATSDDDAATWSPAQEQLGRVYRYGSMHVARNVAGRVAVALVLESTDRALFVSDANGSAGTWNRGAVVWSELGVQQHEPRVALHDSGAIDVVHDDYRDRPSCTQSTCESIYLDTSCDEGDSWLASESRLDVDAGDGVATHSEDSEVAVAATGRLHVTWTDYGGTPVVRHVGLDPSPIPTPEVVMTDLGADPCEPPGYRLDIVPSSLDTCGSPAFQWLEDGVPVKGATASTFDAPRGTGTHRYRCEIACTPSRPCANATRTVTLTSNLPTSAVLGRDIAGWMRVSKSGPRLRVAWDDLPLAATGYALYAGRIASLHVNRRYDHASWECAIARSPPTAPSTSVIVDAPVDDAYFLIAPADCVGEGEVGADSFGTRRPLTGSGTACGPMP